MYNHLVACKLITNSLIIAKSTENGKILTEKDIKKQSYIDQIDWHLKSGSAKLPLPNNPREEKYLQIIIDRDSTEKRLQQDKDISQKYMLTTIALVLFSVIFAVSCFLYGLIHLGAGAQHFREIVQIEAGKPSSPSPQENLFHTDTKRVAR